MYEFYKKSIPESILKKSRKDLKNIYSSVPETEGCMENLNKENGCGAVCCAVQNPSVSYAEFLNSWFYIKKNWDNNKIIELIKRSIINSLSNNIIKGCVFWDKTTKYCTQHLNRPLACRLYSQNPDEEFRPRYERLKILHPDVDFMYQCGLTRTVGKKPTKEDTDGWFKEIGYIESDIGIPFSIFNDKDGGSYRTYHDHLLLYLGSDTFLSLLYGLKNKGTQEEKEKFINSINNKIEIFFPKLKI